MTVEAIGLGKTYGSTRAVDALSFELRPGMVTGFLGPNGAGKSTTMRLMLGLDGGDGTTLWDGKRLVEHDHVTRVVGAHLDAKFFHPSRSARNHLRMLATEASIPSSRIDEVIRLVGLDEVADASGPSGFSLGMGQRLGLAGAILAAPKVLLLDEPANGLDPQSIQWLRDFLRHYAGQGNTVFVSSHLLSEMSLMADHLVVIAAGQLIADESIDDVRRAQHAQRRAGALLGPRGARRRARAPRAWSPCAEGAGRAGRRRRPTPTASATSRSGPVSRVRELTRRTASLEEAFLELTSDQQQFRTGDVA